MKKVQMERLRLHVDSLDDTLRPVLESIGTAISKCGERADKACKSGPEEWAEIVELEQGAIVEALLGAALVSAQSTLVGVYSRASNMIPQLGPADRANPNLPFEPSKGSMYDFGTQVPAGLAHAAAINALANYFKHGDEWALDGWGRWVPKGTAKKATETTITQIRQLGLKEGSTANMRTGAEALGCKEESDLSPILHAVRTWSQSILDELKKAPRKDSGE